MSNEKADGGPDLKLNPGAPVRRQRSTCRCTVCTGLVFVGLLALGFGVQISRGAYRDITNPHRELYYEGTGDYDRSAVIQPLIGEKDRFDIYTTVWLRGQGPDGTAEEKPIYQDTLFKSVHLRDEVIRATAKYQLPTETFKQQNLTNYNLRASFVIVPTSPSLLDHLSNFSTWIPNGVHKPPARVYDSGIMRTIRNEALDSFALFVPLLEFHHINSSCPTKRKTLDNSSFTHYEHDEDDDDDEEEEISTTAAASSRNQRKHQRGPYETPHTSTEGQLPLKSHPYVITRTNLFALDMTKLYKRKAYNKAHKALCRTSCGQDEDPPKLDWKLCHRKYSKNGNMETRLQLQVPPLESTGAGGVEWAYAPYLSSDRGAWGPKDLVPIPVNREKCSTPATVLDQDAIEVVWNVTFSVQTLAKHFFSTLISVSSGFNMTDTEDNINRQHDMVQRMQGIKGHRIRDDIHPRRSLVITILSGILGLCTPLVRLHYWATVTSTIGISIPGTSLIVLSTLLEFAFTVTDEALKDNKEDVLVVIVIQLLRGIPMEMTTWFRIKALTRADISWRTGSSYIPVITFAQATHGERASQRMKGQIKWRLALIIYAVTCGVFYLFKPETVFLIKPVPQLPPASPSENNSRIVEALIPSLVAPAASVGFFLQLWFNRLSRTFAGGHKLVTVLHGLQTTFVLINAYSGSFMGNGDVREGLPATTLITVVLMVISCYQVWKYPTVSPEEGEE